MALLLEFAGVAVLLHAADVEPLRQQVPLIFVPAQEFPVELVVPLYPQPESMAAEMQKAATGMP